MASRGIPGHRGGRHRRPGRRSRTPSPHPMTPPWIRIARRRGLPMTPHRPGDVNGPGLSPCVSSRRADGHFAAVAPGIVATSGEATATSAGTPGRESTGVATEEPPTPKPPMRPPTAPPARVISGHGANYTLPPRVSTRGHAARSPDGLLVLRGGEHRPRLGFGSTGRCCATMATAGRARISGSLRSPVVPQQLARAPWGDLERATPPAALSLSPGSSTRPGPPRATPADPSTAT